MSEQAYRCSSAVLGFWTDVEHNATDVENLQPLLRALRGKLEKGSALQREQPGGQPRSWTALRSFSDIVDADLMSAAVWCEQPAPQLPRSLRRVCRGFGGRLAVIRDTSLSMAGLWNAYASLLCSKVVELAKRRRMHVGYLEFNNEVATFLPGISRNFFSREYTALLNQVRRVPCQGSTNYELPLGVAISEFCRARGRNLVLAAALASQPSASPPCSRDQHILFLTDGQPNNGDRSVSRQLAAARRLGIAIHTIFLGDRDCPTILDTMSLATQGTRYVAKVAPGTLNIEVVPRC